MADTIRCELPQLAAELAKRLKKVRADVDGAMDRTLGKGVEIAKSRVPVAFGELRDSIHVVGKAIVADAPHAGPVEYGSLPHMPPVEPIERWCELQGFDNPKSAAWAIAMKIKEEGTRPRFYMRGSLPGIHREMATQIRRALGK